MMSVQHLQNWLATRYEAMMSVQHLTNWSAPQYKAMMLVQHLQSWLATWYEAMMSVQHLGNWLATQYEAMMSVQHLQNWSATQYEAMMVVQYSPTKPALWSSIWKSKNQHKQIKLKKYLLQERCWCCWRCSPAVLCMAATRVCTVEVCLIMWLYLKPPIIVAV